MTGDRDGAPPRRVLIYRLGSLGDTVVALPCFHLIARAFPGAERFVLRGYTGDAKAAPIAAVLGDSGLVQGYIDYPVGLRSPTGLLDLRHRIAAWRPDILIYLAEPRGALSVWRDLLFFRACGIPRVVGAPLSADLRQHRFQPERGLWEAEADRLARCLVPLGDAHADAAASWDLRLTAEERAAANQALAGWPGATRFVAASIGTKLAEKDWGDANWTRLLTALSRQAPDLGLALVGAEVEATRSEALAARWSGPRLNLCGRLPLRVSAAVLARATFFLGHDSGPTHLAAAAGTACVAVFARHSRPGTWFPFGERHVVLYPGLRRVDSRYVVAGDSETATIADISPDIVLDACQAVLARATGGGKPEESATG